MKKKVVSCGLALAVALGCMSGCVIEEAEERSDISYLYVDTGTGGFTDGYLKKLEPLFEEAYKDVSFADGKKGVDLVINISSDNGGDKLLSVIANKNYNVHFVEGMNYINFVGQDLLMDITDVVKEELSDGSGTIESKLYDDQKSYFTAKGGNYYALPVFAGFTGVNYNAKLFEDKSLYFADEEGYYPSATSSYTGKAYTGRGFVESSADKKSPGPDGIYNTAQTPSFDDGLPSSYEEFFYMLDEMKADTTPFIWYGGHYSNYLFQALLCANSTKTELSANFSFNSGTEEITYVDGFTNGEPNLKKAVIDDDNGYLMSQQYNRYLVLKFMKHLFSNSDYYDSRSAGSSLSNTQVQKLFEESTLTSLEDIAMMFEGNYWYNEAQAELDESVDKYGATAKNRDFRYMPMPAIETGTVNEGAGRSLALADTLSYCMVVNNNIKGNAEKTKLAKEFVKFFYLDSSLQATTMEVGVPVAMKYDLTDEQFASLDHYPQSVWSVYKQSKDTNQYVSPYSANPIFYNNESKFAFKTTKYFFHSTIGGIEVGTPFEAFTQRGATAQEYFEGMKITPSVWTSTYNKD